MVIALNLKKRVKSPNQDSFKVEHHYLKQLFLLLLVDQTDSKYFCWKSAKIIIGWTDSQELLRQTVQINFGESGVINTVPRQHVNSIYMLIHLPYAVKLSSFLESNLIALSSDLTVNQKAVQLEWHKRKLYDLKHFFSFSAGAETFV